MKSKRYLALSLFSALALGSLTPMVGSQTKYFVVPAQYANAEGGTRNAYPFKYSGARTQMVFDQKSLGFTKGLIWGLTFRRDGTHAKTYGPHTLNMEVTLSVSPRTPKNVSYAFAQNRSSKLVTKVYPATSTLNVQLSNMPATAPAPWASPYIITIPFSSPYMYTGGNLCLEFEGKGATGTPYFYADAITTKETATGSRVYIYPPGATTNTCAPLIGNTPKITVSSFQCFLGKQGYFDVNSYQSLAMTFLAIGSNAKSWGAMALPFDLGPLGAKGCYLFNDIICMLAQKSDASATRAKARYYLDIPEDNSLLGASLYMQGYIPVVGANGLNLLTTQGCMIQFGQTTATYPLQELWNTSASETYGFMSTGAYGLVTRFYGALQ